ncbi:MAG: ABC transporter permease [bacterium]
MLKNLLLTAWRNLKKRKGYAFINIMGLAIGIACCLLILLYVKQELSYDRQHPDYERIYRVALDIRSGSSNRVFANASATLAPALKKDFPQIETAFRLLKTDSRLVSDGGEKKFYEKNFFYADPEVLQVLCLPLRAGNPQEALLRPATVVISEALAFKYFGEANPTGKTLIIADKKYEVTGVFTDAGFNSHATFDLIASFSTLAEWPLLENWYLTVFYNYIKLKPNVDLADFKQKIEHFANRYVGDGLKEQNASFHYFLQPIHSIHLHSRLDGELAPPGTINSVYIFSVVSFVRAAEASRCAKCWSPVNLPFHCC